MLIPIPWTQVNMARVRDPKKEIEEALRHAEDRGGESKSAAATPGAKCIVPTTMPNAVAVNFVSRAFGVRRKTQAIMHDN